MADPTSPNPARLDPNIAALDPSIRKMKEAGTQEALSGLARIGRGQPAPPRPDYTTERTRLIGMLGQLTELETMAQSDAAKTRRAQFALQNTLLSTIGKIESAELGAQGSVLSSRLDYFTARSKQINDEILRNGPREISDLSEAPRTSIGTLGKYIKERQVKPGTEAAFAKEVSDTVAQLKTDPRLVQVYREEIQKTYGVDISDWFAGKQGDVSLSPIANSLIPVLQQGLEAQVKSQEVIVKGTEELANIATQIMDTPGVDSGSVLGRAVRKYADELGIGIEGLGSSGLPAKPGETAAPAPGMAAPAGGETATKTAKTEGLRPYLNEQRDLILKELDRLENAEDPESVRIRQKLMASPALAQWAKDNGYADYRPDQQFKAALAYRRKALRDQDAAFNAQLESDILAGEAGTPLGQAGVKIKRFLTGETARRDRTIDEGLTEARRRRSEKGGEATAPAAAPASAPAPGADSAAVVGGAAGPADKAPNVSESAPSITEKPKETVEAAMAEEPTIKFDEGGVFEERGEAPTAERRGAGIRFGTARARNEFLVGAHLRQADPTTINPEIETGYREAQAYQKSDPMRYAATLQKLADKLTARPPTGEITGMGDPDYLARDWRSQRRATAEEPEPEPMPAPEVEVPAETAPPETEAPAPTPETPTPPDEGVEAGPGDVPSNSARRPPDGMDSNEATAKDAEFLAQLEKASSFETTAKAPSIPSAPSAMAEPSQPSAQSRTQPSLTERMAEATKAPMFQSFGAEAATAAAGDAMMAYRQLEEDTRRRRAAMLRGGMMPA